MRKALHHRNGKRFTVTATVKRYGGKSFQDHWKETILLVDLQDSATAEPLADHIWFTVGKSFANLNAQTGDKIQFDARVDRYEKKAGIDYHLEFPTKLKILASDPSLYPEETARTVGSGIPYAKQLKEGYIAERMARRESNSNFSDYGYGDDFDTDWIKKTKVAKSTAKPDIRNIPNAVASSLRVSGSGRWIVDIQTQEGMRVEFVDELLNLIAS